jgi:hypothetical protein
MLTDLFNKDHSIFLLKIMPQLEFYHKFYIKEFKEIDIFIKFKTLLEMILANK